MPRIVQCALCAFCAAELQLPERLANETIDSFTVLKKKSELSCGVCSREEEVGLVEVVLHDLGPSETAQVGLQQSLEDLSLKVDLLEAALKAKDSEIAELRAGQATLLTLMTQLLKQ